MDKKIISIFLVIVIILSNSSVASAQTYKEKSYGCRFSAGAWERTLGVYDLNPSTDDSAVLYAQMTYGYNTFAIDEDYCWAYSISDKVKSELVNTKGTYTGSYKKKAWSKIEVTHHGNNISDHKYRIYFYSTDVSSFGLYKIPD
jgi:hypothetical protein